MVFGRRQKKREIWKVGRKESGRRGEGSGPGRGLSAPPPSPESVGATKSVRGTGAKRTIPLPPPSSPSDVSSPGPLDQGCARAGRVQGVQERSGPVQVSHHKTSSYCCSPPLKRESATLQKWARLPHGKNNHVESKITMRPAIVTLAMGQTFFWCRVTGYPRIK